MPDSPVRYKGIATSSRQISRFHVQGLLKYNVDYSILGCSVLQLASMIQRRSNKLSIVLVIPASAGDRQAQLVEEAAEIVGACPSLAVHPLTWSFSAVGVAEQDPEACGRIQRRLELRRRNAGDEIAPIGYAGAPNTYLQLRELQLELDWAVMNPWETGLDRIFGGEKRVFVPAGADLRRADARRLYAEFADIWVSGYAPAQTRTSGQLFCNAGGLSYALPLAHLDPPWRSQIVMRRKDPGSALLRHLKRLLRRESYAVTMLLLENAEQIEVLRSFLARADSVTGRKGIGTIVPLRTPTEYRVAETGPQQRIGVPPWSPEQLARALGAAERRAEAPNEAEYTRTLLRMLGGCGPVPSTGSRRNSVRDTALSVAASMMGHAAISEGDCSAELHNGRLAAFTYRGENLLAPGTSELALTVNGKSHEFVTESAVSFELENARGLRSSFTLEAEMFHGEPLRAWADYYFIEGAPHLVLELGIDWPHLSGRNAFSLESSRLVTLPLARLGTDDALGITGYYPDGSGYRLTLHGGERAPRDPLCGWSFLFRHAGRNLSLAHLDPVSKPVLCCPIETHAYGETTDVILTLGPMYHDIQGRALSGTRERRSILLSPTAIDTAGVEQFVRALGPLLARYGSAPRSRA